jgi:hypothetical protein
MEVTGNVIRDLLPLYAANEVSADTRELVAKYLEHDPQLAQAARDLASTPGLGEVPAAMTSEHQLQAFREAKRMMFYRNLVWAGVACFGLIIGLTLALLAARGVGVF